MNLWTKEALANHRFLKRLVIDPAVARRAPAAQRAANPPTERLGVAGQPERRLKSPPGAKSASEPPKNLKIVILGQIRGGKNNMIVTRSGLHFPKPEWEKWRNEAVSAVKQQLPPGFVPFSEPATVRLTYIAGDRRRRDQPAIMDSIFHVLEKAGVVTDDALIWVSESSRGYDKTAPMAEIEFLQIA
jgi:Holliday junction resolvase RusA-like endonuclease